MLEDVSIRFPTPWYACASLNSFTLFSYLAGLQLWYSALSNCWRAMQQATMLRWTTSWVEKGLHYGSHRQEPSNTSPTLLKLLPCAYYYRCCWWPSLLGFTFSLTILLTSFFHPYSTFSCSVFYPGFCYSYFIEIDSNNLVFNFWQLFRCLPIIFK